MMMFLIGLLTLVMVSTCVILIFLVLIQLPKKEAGAGLAFGGAATDALFGAGSGNTLTRITKYAAGTFFVMAVILSVLQNRFHNRPGTEFEQKLNTAAPLAIPAPATAPKAAAKAPTTAPTTTNLLLSTPQAVESTNVPAVTPTVPPGTNK